MKSFSPAGAATKAFYGLGARTFGNPDGATRGGGAYARGGANINGPDQGGGPHGGGGLTGTVQVTAGLVVRPASFPPPNFLAFFGFGLATDPSGPGSNFGLLFPNNLGGNVVESLWIFYFTNNASGSSPYTSSLFEVTLQGTFAQGAFTQVAYFGQNGPKSYLTVDVSGFSNGLDNNGQPITIWQWSQGPDPVSDFSDTQRYDVIFT